MSKTQNNKELVRVGHEFAKAMGADTPLIEIAKMVSRLATQLDCTALALHGTQAQRDLLAAENVRLKSAGEIIRHLNANREEANFCGIDDCHIDDAVDAMITPATDAFLTELRAQGVTEYASKRGFSFQHNSIHAHFGNGDVMVGAVTFQNGDAGVCFAPVREKEGGVGTQYEWTKGKNSEQVGSVFVITSSNAEGLEVIQEKLSEAITELRQGGAA